MTNPKKGPYLGDPLQYLPPPRAAASAAPTFLPRRWQLSESELLREEYHRVRRRARAHQANRLDAERWDRAA